MKNIWQIKFIKNKIFSLFFFLCTFFIFPVFLYGIPEKEISNSFELRYFSNNSMANGETDFKGKTEIFNTEKRIDYLKSYAKYAKRFFNDPYLNKKVVSDSEVEKALKTLKPQPLPSIRKRIIFKDCKWLGYKWSGYDLGQREQDQKSINYWNAIEGIEVKDEVLFIMDDNVIFSLPIKPQSWRFFLEFHYKPASDKKRMSFKLLDSKKKTALTVGFGEDGMLYYTSKGIEYKILHYNPNEWYYFKVEVDLVDGYKRYNLYINNKLIADYVILENIDTNLCEKILFKCNERDMIDDIWGVGYELLVDEEPDYPYSIQTFIDEDFAIKPDIDGWNEIEYDDSKWLSTELPHAHGGERYAGEDLLLRNKVNIDEYETAVLNIETIDPRGDIFINGELVREVTNREPNQIDVSDFIKENDVNLIAVRVEPFLLRKEKRMHHAPTDMNIGHFAGRIYLDLRRNIYINNLFIYTESIGNPATLKTCVQLKNDSGNNFNGQLTIKLYPWFPEEQNNASASVSKSIKIETNKEKRIEIEIHILKPKLWSYKAPNLYKVVAILEDSAGNPIDDYVITTGIRTISQEGGTFRINGEPELLRAPLVFGYRPPLDKIATWNRCGPLDWLMRELLMIRKMNGNGVRMSVHHGMVLGINDSRWVEMADQLGLMWIWGTTLWIRSKSPWASDWSTIDSYIKQVYNHPSIIIWQPTNHPDFDNDFNKVILFYKKIYNLIYSIDPSRLISPTADLRGISPPADDGNTDLDGNSVITDHIWTAPMITRGSMDCPNGYGRDWEYLRKWPYPPDWRGGIFMPNFLDSKERAYFNFEHEEVIGQPNWSLRKGKPHYCIHSYEWGYDEGSIGRRLTTDEWQESQAWQALCVYEAIRKMRWLDYDGFCWCTLHGGCNTATYEKPLIDYYGHAKLSYYANRMAFQDVLAGSKNVDIVYGPDDFIFPIVLNLGPKRRVNVQISVKDINGKFIDEKRHLNIILKEGRTTTDLAPFKVHFPEEGHYAIEYKTFEVEN